MLLLARGRRSAPRRERCAGHLTHPAETWRYRAPRHRVMIRALRASVRAVLGRMNHTASTALAACGADEPSGQHRCAAPTLLSGTTPSDGRLQRPPLIVLLTVARRCAGGAWGARPWARTSARQSSAEREGTSWGLNIFSRRIPAKDLHCRRYSVKASPQAPLVAEHASWNDGSATRSARLCAHTSPNTENPARLPV